MEANVLKNKPASTPEAFVHIVGRNMLQNELLLTFLRNETGLEGTCIPKVLSADLFDNKKTFQVQLLILDSKDFDIGSIWNEINHWQREKSYNCLLALCNVDPEKDIEKMAIAHDIRGIFYNNTPLHILSKGISAILKGDIWYSREILKKCLLEARPLLRYANSTAMLHLTLREREILTIIASGYRNKEIADQLNISEYTVKTHIYNIYKKINVSNRLQASLWATKNL